MDNLKQGVQLIGEAQNLISGGLRFDKMGEARELFAGATNFFHGLKHMGEQEEEGLQDGGYLSNLINSNVTDSRRAQDILPDSMDRRTRW